MKQPQKVDPSQVSLESTAGQKLILDAASSMVLNVIKLPKGLKIEGFLNIKGLTKTPDSSKI